MCLSPCSIFFPTSWSSTVPHPVLASRNVFMPCGTERLTPSWFRWWFRKLSSTRCILWNAPLPSNCRKWSLSSESPILKINVISSWWWPFHPGCGEHPYLPQTLPLTSPQPQPLTRSFELNLSAGQIGAICRLPPGSISKRIHPSTDPKISQVMPQNLLHLSFKECNTVFTVSRIWGSKLTLLLRKPTLWVLPNGGLLPLAFTWMRMSSDPYTPFPTPSI